MRRGKAITSTYIRKASPTSTSTTRKWWRRSRGYSASIWIRGYTGSAATSSTSASRKALITGGASPPMPGALSITYVPRATTNCSAASMMTSSVITIASSSARPSASIWKMGGNIWKTTSSTCSSSSRRPT